MPDETALTTPAAARFDYRTVAPADRDWLRDVTDCIRRSARKIAADMILIGMQIRAVRDRLPRGAWMAWVEAEFAWSHQTAVRFVQVADAFAGVQQIDKFDPSGLYVLSMPSTPQAAREHALSLARDGRRITHAVARGILLAHRPEPAPGRGDTRRLAPLNARDRQRTAAADPAPADPVRAAVEDLLRDGSALHLSVVDDADTGDRLITGTYYPLDDARPVGHAVSDEPAEVLLILAGREPVKPCGSCREGKPLYSAFSRDSNRPDGRVQYCKACERARIRAHKEKKRGAGAGRKGSAGRGRPAPARRPPPAGPAPTTQP